MDLTREQAMVLLQKYNKEPFHIQHALTVEGVMRWYAQELGFEPDFWALCGLLHDIDFEVYPDQHCQKAPQLLAEVNASDEMVHAFPRLRPVQRRRTCPSDGEGHVRCR